MTEQAVSSLVTIVTVFSPGKIQGMIGGHGMGGACSHIKDFELSHSHIKGNSVLKACSADMPYIC